MTSRERVLKTVNHQVPDRVPMDLGGLKASGIAVDAYHNLKKTLKIAGKSRVLDPRFLIADVEPAILKRFHLDVVPLDLTTVDFVRQPEKNWVPRRLFSGTDVLMPPGTRIEEDADGSWFLLDPAGKRTSYRMPKDGHYFDDISFDRGTEGINPALFKPVDSIADETLARYSQYARELYDGTEYALLGWGCGICFLGLSLITDRRANVTMGMPSEWMVMLMTEKETCHDMMGRSVDATIKCLETVHQAIGDRAFGWGIAADDSGTQRGEFIRPELWAEMMKPHYKRLCDWIHTNTKWKTFLHSCGSVYNLIPHFIDAGVDILNPVQTSAANMDPAKLKKEFGKRIVFWGGGCDTQHVLGTAKPEAVQEQVRERMDIFKPGGGYVFNQVHNIQANVPPENIVAMFDAAHDSAGY